MNRRLQIVNLSIKHLTLGGSLKSWLYTCFGPTSGVLAKSKIESITIIDDYYKIKLSGCDDPLFYNTDLSIKQLYQSIEEQLFDWQWHYYQIPQTRIEPNDIVIDCGSAEGIFPLLNHKKAKHIFVFEPLPQYLGGLYKTFDNISNISIIDSALGDMPGDIFINNAGSASSVSDYGNGIKVRIDTIDLFCNCNNIVPNYLKIDVEGHEIELLRGAANVIRNHKPKIAIATYHRKDHDMAIMSLLKSMNSQYSFKLKGIDHYHNGGSVLLHAW